jgi:hypothetical protein
LLVNVDVSKMRRTFIEPNRHNLRSSSHQIKIDYRKGIEEVIVNDVAKEKLEILRLVVGGNMAGEVDMGDELEDGEERGIAKQSLGMSRKGAFP